MGGEEPQPAANIIYETLVPIGIEETAATANASPDPPPHSPPSSANKEELEYVVFRNEISLSSESSKLPESAAPDYFSLDVGNEESDGVANLGEEGKDREGSVRADDVAPIVAAKERTLEGKWFSGNSRFKSPMLRLHTEILDFCNFLSPTLEEQGSRDAAIEAVSNVIKYIWPNVVVEVFGSFKTGLYLPSSDIDVVILGSNVKTPQIGLQALSRALSQRGIAKNIQVIAKARVPIIKFVEKRSGIAFDVSFDVANGPKAAEFIKDAISKWPPLKPLCLILKVFLQQRELNEVYTGGISSYALLSMLIAMLRTQLDRPASPEHNLGVLLVNFFDLYGCKLNTAEVGISCNGGGIFFPKSIKGFVVEDRTSRIAIEDPQAPDNDIGKSSFNYYMAKSAFAMAFTTLSNAKFISRLGPNKSILSAIIRPDSVLLERKGGSSGKSTLNNLFPDSEDRYVADHQEIYCNWPSNDDDEDGLLPRGNGTVTSSDTNCDVIKSSGRKRKSSKEQRSGKKMKDHEETGQYSGQRPSLRRHRGDSNGSSRYDHHGSGSSKWI